MAQSQDKPPRKLPRRWPKGHPKAGQNVARADYAEFDAMQAARGVEPPTPPSDPPPSDESPGPAPRRDRGKGRSKATTTKAIATALTELLQMPAVPCAVLGDAWAAEHFKTQGAALAEQIAALSERNEVLRRWCERALEGESVAVLLIGGIMYVYPPLLHWGIVPGPAGLLGVPVAAPREPIVPEPPPPEPQPPPPSTSTPPAPQAPTGGNGTDPGQPPAFAVPEQHFPR